MLFLTEFWATAGTGLRLGPQRARSTGNVLELKAVQGLKLPSAVGDTKLALPKVWTQLDPLRVDLTQSPGLVLEGDFHKEGS